MYESETECWLFFFFKLYKDLAFLFIYLFFHYDILIWKMNYFNISG